MILLQTCKPDSVGCYHLSCLVITEKVNLLTLPDTSKEKISPGRQKIGIYIAFQYTRFTHYTCHHL